MALRIEIPNDKVVNWMLLNNRIYGSAIGAATDHPEASNGVVFYPTYEFTNFSNPAAGPNLRGIEKVELSDGSQKLLHTITAADFQKKHWLCIVTSGTNPMDVGDYWKIFNSTLHNHANPCLAGVVLWRGPSDIVDIAMRTDGTCQFSAGTGNGLTIAHYIADTHQKDYNSTAKITFVAHAQAQAPNDPMNPPRYP